MSDDETRPIEPEAPTPPPPAPQAAPAPAGYPAYAEQQRPRFVDQVLGVRAVVATALACLIVGGLSGFILGHAAGSDDGGLGRGGFFQQRGAFPGGPNGQAPNQQFGQQFGQGQNGG